MQKGVMKLAAKLYSGAKNNFKTKHFLNKGGHDNIDELRRQQPPPENMEPQKWNELLDYYCRDDNVHRSIVNSGNRSHHHYPSRTGTKAFVETRYERHQTSGQYPSLIEGFREHHSKNGKIQMPHLAQQQYDEMTNLLRAQSINQMTEEQILEQVLGSRRDFKRGRGHVVKPVHLYHSSASPSPSPASSRASPSPSPGPSRVYTQAEVDSMMEASRTEMAKTKKKQARTDLKLNAVIKCLAEKNVVIQFDDEDGNGTEPDSDSHSE